MELKGKYCPIIKAQCKMDKCAAYYKEQIFKGKGNPIEEDCCRILKPDKRRRG